MKNMAKVQELEIKNKYTGEIIKTIPADTPETVREKIKKVHKNQHLLREMDFFERAQILGKLATKLRFKKALRLVLSVYRRQTVNWY
jgi:acyl-CoA reductase-like NAD-dependent aldehyde dehydrogenase